MGFWKRLGKAIIAEPTMKDIEDMREELSPENSKYLTKKQKKMIKEELKELEEHMVQKEMINLKEVGVKRNIREKAEKRLHGRVKSQRIAIREIDKEAIFRKFENKCAICGEVEGLHIHHKDKNPTNNREDNLIVLCGVCHKKIHMKV